MTNNSSGGSEGTSSSDITSNSGGTTTTILEGARRFVHVHELDLTRFYAPATWKCVLCRHYFTPGHEGLHCVSCEEGFCVHVLCYDALLMAKKTAPLASPSSSTTPEEDAEYRRRSVLDDDFTHNIVSYGPSSGDGSGGGNIVGDTDSQQAAQSMSSPSSSSSAKRDGTTPAITFLARRLTEEEVAARAADVHKATAISDTVSLVQALCLRNVHWKSLLLGSRNPLVTLPSVSAEHAKWYDSCCAKVANSKRSLRPTASVSTAPSAPSSANESATPSPHNDMHGPMLALALGEIRPTTSAATTHTLAANLAQNITHGHDATTTGAPSSTGVSTKDISQLQDALRFATAVYGLAYQKNSMASCAASVAMRLFHPDRLMPKDEVNNTAVTEILALPRSSLVHSFWSYKTLEPSFCVILDHATSTVVLAFRGSLSTADFLSDACGLTRDFGGSSGEEGIAGAHFGMAHMIDLIFEEPVTAATTTTVTAEKSAKDCASPVSNPSGQPAVESESGTAAASAHQQAPPSTPSSEPQPPPSQQPRHPSELIKLLHQLLMEEYPTYEFLVTGHSLGGGLSQLFAVRAVTERYPWLHWRSSSSTSSDDRNDGDDGELTHTAAQGPPDDDSGPSILPPPPQTRKKRMRVVAFAPPPVLTMPSADWFDGWVTCVVGGTDVVCRLQLNTVDRLANNFGGGGVAARSAKATDEHSGGSGELPSAAGEVLTELTEEMHLVGRIILLTYPTDKERNRIVQIARGDFLLHHIFLVPDMVANHLMDRYAKGLRL